MLKRDGREFFLGFFSMLKRDERGFFVGQVHRGVRVGLIN
jgi:hypothetical protein